MKRFKQLYDFAFLPWVIAFIGILFTSLIAWKSYEWISKTEKERFNAACNQITFLVQKKLEVNVQLLLSAAAFIDASDSITDKEWKVFADKHASFQSFLGLQAIGYAAHTPEGYTIAYFEPITPRNAKAIGFNMISEPTRKRDVEKAVQSGTVSFSSKIELVQEKEPDERAGFVIYAPLYQKGASINTLQERIEASKGVVYAAIKAKTLFEDTLKAQYNIIDFEIYDGDTPTEAYKLYDANTELTLPRLERYTTVEFYGKKWTFYFKADKALDMNLNRYVPFAQLFFGGLFSIIVALWIYALQRTRKEAYAIADEKTKKLAISRYQLEKYVEIIDANVIISSTDCEGIITEASEAFCRISGYTKEELIGQNHRIVRYPDMPDSLYKEMWEELAKGHLWKGEMKNRRKDGSYYWVDAIISPRYNEKDEVIGYTAIRQDITDKKRIEELSITDTLTNLYNRLKLNELFSLHLSLAKRHGSPFSVIMLDIDKFKLVNDTYGHQVGDGLLQEIAKLLKESIRLEDVVGRWGGEEFLILLPSTTLDAASALAELLRARIQDNHFSVVDVCTVSLGVATFNIDDDQMSIVARADEALYRAKEKGRNRVEHSDLS
ncbi:MAG: diguanylate cyclase [Sulfurospirillaceae bacterium]|nr:diguanylate cyclase [Sulfurospirillaceae bacterium]